MYPYSFGSVTEPKSVCLTCSKANDWDTGFAARKGLFKRQPDEERRRGEGELQTRLLPSGKGGEQVFFIIKRLEATCMLMKRVGKHDFFVSKDGACKMSKHTLTYIPCSFRGKDNTGMKQNPAPVVRTRGSNLGHVPGAGISWTGSWARFLEWEMQGLPCSWTGTVSVDPESRLVQRQPVGLLVGSEKAQ